MDSVQLQNVLQAVNIIAGSGEETFWSDFVKNKVYASGALDDRVKIVLGMIIFDHYVGSERRDDQLKDAVRKFYQSIRNDSWRELHPALRNALLPNIQPLREPIISAFTDHLFDTAKPLAAALNVKFGDKDNFEVPAL